MTTPSLSCWNGNTGGQQMSYDALRRLIAWQNAPGASPTASEQEAYDGEGNRVWQQAQSVSGGGSTTTTTDTVYELGTDELTTTAITGQSSTTTNVRTYPLPGGALAERDATGLYYLATDQLGTPIATLRLDDGTLVGTQLRTPYGQARYAATSSPNGGMHSSFGWTGQREDTQAPGSSGLDYFNARYYDPLVGRFTSADDVVGSDPLLDGYAYVGGMVESATDPSGHECDSSGVEAAIAAIACDDGGWDNGNAKGGGSGYLISPGSLAIGMLSQVVAAYAIAASIASEESTAPTVNPAIGTPVLSAGTVAAAKAAALEAAREAQVVAGQATIKVDNTNLRRPKPKPGGKPPKKPGPGGGGGKPPKKPPVAGPAHPDDDGCGCGGWVWLYHGSQALFDTLNVATAIASQMARGPSYHPELGYGIYFTDSPARASQYMANKATGRVYRAKVPQEMLDRLPSGRISTNGDPQWVVNNQADADILNQTLEWRTPVDLITNNPFPPDEGC